MAIRNPCSGCGQILSAPDDMTGKNVACPSCGTDNRIVGPDDLKAMIRREAEDEVRRRRVARDKVRLDLLDHLDRNRRSTDRLDTTPARAALIRLQGYADILLVTAYGVPPLLLAGGGFLAWRAEWALHFRLLFAGLFVFGSLMTFLGLKVLRETVRAVADLGDLQLSEYGQAQPSAPEASEDAHAAEERSL